MALGVALTVLNGTPFTPLSLSLSLCLSVCLSVYVYVSVCVCVCLVPVDWLSLVVHMPFLVLYSDIRQGLFYSVLLCFWIIFAGEHMMVCYSHLAHLSLYVSLYLSISVYLSV